MLMVSEATPPAAKDTLSSVPGRLSLRSTMWPAMAASSSSNRSSAKMVASMTRLGAPLLSVKKSGSRPS